jgi:hypothetical protein
MMGKKDATQIVIKKCRKMVKKQFNELIIKFLYCCDAECNLS